MSTNASDEQFHQQIDRLQLVAKLLNFRACRSEETNRKSALAMKKMQANKSSLKEQSQEIVEDLEGVIFSIVTSLKAFQAEARATLFSLQTQLQGSEKNLMTANETIKQLTEKVEQLELTVSENKRLFEVNLQAIHITYINIMESIFERIQTKILKDLEELSDHNDQLHGTFTSDFKALGVESKLNAI
ncbi:unnamed protein product [Protopolystoma xenopodis]|uniref:Uncharacterized protein n=1 Tax=Protopolystoma xenopodis TaxID=117903 RepID=A0A3S5CI77_9PLAT|nr:unnamed protein product [Protopolystoma xenopodis]